MRYGLNLSVAIVMVLVVGGCESSDPYEAAAEKTVAKAKEFMTIVQGVKTGADADAAAPKLEALARDFEGISAELKKQPKMTADQKKKVQKIFDDSKAEMDKLSAAGNTLNDEAVGEKLAPSFLKAGLAMSEVALQLEVQGLSAD